VRLDGKVVLITGASEGIGAACAAEFAAAGARLSLTARSAEGLSRAGGADAVITAGDLTVESVRRQAVDQTLDRFGAIDLLINNAGIGLYGPSWSSTMDDARQLMELNFFALLGMIQLVTPHMRSRAAGTIVNVSSIGGKMPLPWMTIYSASKYAVTALTEGLRMELRASGVKTMLVCPGYVTTGFQSSVLAGQAPESVVRARRQAITPAECARAIRRGVERDARTIVAPKVGWLLVALARLFPGLVEARMAEMNGTA
jgi:short-subunit dehydrogenase